MADICRFCSFRSANPCGYLVVLLLSHWFDLYDSASLSAKWDQLFRLLLVLGFVALALAAVVSCYPELLPGNDSVFWD